MTYDVGFVLHDMRATVESPMAIEGELRTYCERSLRASLRRQGCVDPLIRFLDDALVFGGQLSRRWRVYGFGQRPITDGPARELPPWEWSADMALHEAILREAAR